MPLLCLPKKEFRVILADPPWSYTNWRGKDNGAAKAHYRCLTVNEVAALPVQECVGENAALLMWVTGPVMAEGRHVPIIEAWGFRPVTMAFVWVKTNGKGQPCCGLGFYTRSGSEFCILGIRGSYPRRAEATKVMQVIQAPRRRHSEKPEEQYTRIEALFEGPYLELFARRRRVGWESWGDQLE